MLDRASATELSYPVSEPPKTGEVIEIAPGILWARIPLPFRLNHVNIYLIEDGDGWAVLDTGIADQPTRQTWETLAVRLQGRRLTRLIVTHYHPDHIGLAGWLCERFEIPLLTSQTTLLGCQNVSLSPGSFNAKPYRDFYQKHGMPSATLEKVSTDGHAYLKMVTPLPPTFRRIVDGEVLTIGGRNFLVMMGDGHAPEQAMLYCKEEGLFLAADQVIAKITPNVSVWAVDPDGDPLGLYLRSLNRIRTEVDGDAFVLPGHQLPFYGLRHRCAELAKHHADRCALIMAACRKAACSVADLVPVLFSRALDPHQLSFAFSETHAHVNYMIRRGELSQRQYADGTVRVTAV